MAKRYHKSESHHERSMHRHHSVRGGHYEGAEPRRRQEMQDAGMIREDHRQVANLPQEVIMKPYPMPGGYTPEDLDDTLHGIDRQMGYDNGKKMAHFSPKKV